MIVNQGANKMLTVQQNTVDGVRINGYLIGATADTAISISDFVPNNITIKVTLFRGNDQFVIMQNNLRVLGLYASLTLGQTDWTRGNVMTYDTTGVKETRLLSLYLPFGGPVNVKENDKLVIEMQVATGTFGTTIDATASYIEFNQMESIGYEFGVPIVQSEVVQANIDSQTFSMGDNVSRIVMLNFDKNGFTNATQVIRNINLSSKQLAQSLNLYDIFNLHRNYYSSEVINRRYAATQPTLSDQALPYLPDFPQSLVVFGRRYGRLNDLDNCSMTVTFDGTQVAASQNYCVWQKFLMSQELVTRALRRQAKHEQQKAQGLPASLRA